MCIVVMFFLYLSEASVKISERKFQCDVCEKCFKTENKLKKHEFQHKDPYEYPHECDICKEKFLQITKLKQHTREHHKASDRKSTRHVRATRSSKRAVNGKQQRQKKKYEFLKLACLC